MQSDRPKLESGMNAMGQPVSESRLQAAYDWLRSLSFEPSNADDIVASVAQFLERDKPFEAMEFGKKHLDLPNVYRLLAYLLTDAQYPCNACAEGQELVGVVHFVNGYITVPCTAVRDRDGF